MADKPPATKLMLGGIVVLGVVVLLGYRAISAPPAHGPESTGEAFASYKEAAPQASKVAARRTPVGVQQTDAALVVDPAEEPHAQATPQPAKKSHRKANKRAKRNKRRGDLESVEVNEVKKKEKKQLPQRRTPFARAKTPPPDDPEKN